MNQQDFPQFQLAMHAAADMLGKQRISTNGLAMMAKMLEPYDLTSVTRAMTLHLRESKWLPTPAELIEIIEGSVDDTAALAWQRVMNAIGPVGHYRSVRFDGPDGPAIHYALHAIGGWQRICHTPEDDLPFRERDFRAHYRRATEKAVTFGDQGCPKVLAGAMLDENSFNGFNGQRVTRVLTTGRTTETTIAELTTGQEPKQLPGPQQAAVSINGIIADLAKKSLDKAANP